MPLHGTVRAVRIPLEGSVAATDACLLLRGDPHPFALSGAWVGGGALAGSDPVEVAPGDADPFGVLDRQPRVSPGAPDDMVGGGWFGYLGYALGARREASASTAAPPAAPTAVRACLLRPSAAS